MATMLGLPITPCPTDTDHDWHTDGRRFCPGIPNHLEQPADVSLVAGVGFSPTSTDAGELLRCEVDYTAGQMTVQPWTV